MKLIYLHYLNLRVWFLRHRLRQMGFRDVPDQKTAEALVRLQMEPSDAQVLFLDCIKIGFVTVAVLTLSLVLGFRLMEPFQIVVPPPQRFFSPPSNHDVAPLPQWKFGPLVPQRYIA